MSDLAWLVGWVGLSGGSVGRFGRVVRSGGSVRWFGQVVRSGGSVRWFGRVVQTGGSVDPPRPNIGLSKHLAFQNF